ncbi:MAG: Spy/CpxP family protein refolding chaperone [Pseudomonadota bacterium]
MKLKLMTAIVLTSALLGGGAGAVLAGFEPLGAGFAPPPHGPEPRSGQFDGRMAKILKLSTQQQQLIKEILDAEMVQIKPLLDKMHESRQLLMQAADVLVFDEAVVREIAAGQAKIETELIVSRISVRSQINNLLTAEQRELEKSLRPEGRQAEGR